MVVYFVRSHTQEEMTRCLQSYLTDNAKYLPKVDGKPSIKCYGTDNHGEYFSTSSDEFFKQLFTGTHRCPTTARGETRRNAPMASSFGAYAESAAPLKLWPFTAATVVRVHNGLVTRSVRVIQENASPFFMMTGEQQDFFEVEGHVLPNDLLRT